MAPVFIFARHVEDVIREGKGTIEIPEGARISAAALDLIRDNKLKVTYVPSGSSAVFASDETLSGREDPNRTRELWLWFFA